MAGTIKIIAGTTFNDKIVIKDEDGEVVDITNGRAKFKIASKRGIADDKAQYFADSNTSGSDLTISNPTAGELSIIVDENTTKDFTPGDYKWQLRYIDESDNVNDTDEGIVIIEDSLIDDEAA